MPVPIPETYGNKAKYIPLPKQIEGTSSRYPNHSPANLHSDTSFLHITRSPNSDFTMQRNGHGDHVAAVAQDTTPLLPGTVQLPHPSPSTSFIQWDWDTEHHDRRLEAKADAALHGAQPFQVDRRVLKDVVREMTGCEVGRINFLSSGTFHKASAQLNAYLVTLIDTRELVARVARRFMPRLKTESEVATMHYLRERTSIPVPDVYYYDANPYNRLGGEYILMSRAKGVPLSRVYHTLSNEELKSLFANVASIIVPLFAQRFSHIGSLYLEGAGTGAPAPLSVLSSNSPTPTATRPTINGFKFMPLLSMSSFSNAATAGPLTRTVSRPTSAKESHIGPIVSWPFFGSNRGDLSHPDEIDRGPWSSTSSYLASCIDREVRGVVLENEGKSAPHRLHLDPDEIQSSRHHHLNAVPGDQSDDSDEWDAQESEEEWDGPGDVMYRDYRRMQRSTFLIAHIMRREESVRKEMGRWMRMMERLGACADHSGATEEFGLDCHDISLENVFVDENDHTQITCVIDWESTTTRPLWACAHLPTFLQSSPFTTRMFREAVEDLARGRAPEPAHPGKNIKPVNSVTAAKEWLHYEAMGARLRLAHRCVEWDGWEEGLVDSILGPEDTEDEWFKDAECTAEALSASSAPVCAESVASTSGANSGALQAASFKRRKKAGHIPLKKEREREQMLNTTGDICGGRGGELGRRLEAWLSVNGDGTRKGWEEEYDAEAE
ncbi:hypothetical protein DEU56DRAFT_980054 [Suillus clintonianus]|uniref:uncharacterized protein n=1 Tax=Suillus clintonianus TaxID=1904413 RepID=UPI001B88424F|nr:uncharacterized protein DEU56DRAFT_980054 [Suillus clintonianus]KAG2140676.1 hypothetical protein DEU56DRAFT_980054 [Suillus clintonianus]